MLYSKNNTDTLSTELFLNPTSEYRGTPFWAWNCKLNKDMLLEQIDELKEMGMGGFHIHCRTGMATEYLGEEFMDLVKACKDKAIKENMLCWLYDEDRWPSGAAGGLVTKEEVYRSRFLLFTPRAYEDNSTKGNDEYNSSARAQRSGSRTLLGKYEVVLKEGYLHYFKKLAEDETPSKGGKLWWAYLEISGDSPWYNNQAYVNTLDKKAINRFIEITHESYFREVGEEFGKAVPAIFTDEPQFTHKETLTYAEEEQDIVLPFTDDFDETYKDTYGQGILECLPELVWELPEGEVSLARYRYHDHICERFTQAFSDNLGSWCETHGIMLTGHMMSEQSLNSQTTALGEAMRSYRSFQLPGIDILCDSREYTTAKQAQSAANQYGRPGVLSELYGVTNWDFDFRGHKLAGDWQAALGITVRVHHLTWVSMEGESKRDYPASIGYQSPWYKEYPLIEDHFSRLNTAMTRGKNSARVGVIHPVESYWIHFGPKAQTALIGEELETNFQNITKWLLFGLIDFDFISEALFPSLSQIQESTPLKVGAMNYDVILVPGCETLRSTTLAILEAFVQGGGKVIFIAEPATMVDAVSSSRAKNLADKSVRIPFSKNKILQTLEPYREVTINTVNGDLSDNLFYQMRVDGNNKWLFICHVNKMTNPDIASIEHINIRVKGHFIPSIYNTMTGAITLCSAHLEGCETWISHEFSQHDSLLLFLEPGIPANTKVQELKNLPICSKLLESQVPISLSEPNTLLLDMAEYAFDDGQWMPKDEILRIDNNFRKKLGYPLRMEALAQPWVNTEEEAFEHTLQLKFNIDSNIEVVNPYLALENAENTIIFLNGSKLVSDIKGWYVDKCIKKVKLPSLSQGQTEIILKIPFNSKTNVEYCYLLGDFGVKVEGNSARIIEPVRKLAFGDWVNQGLPFYAGNVTYHCKFNGDSSELSLEVPQFRNPLLSVSVDGITKGKIAFAPYVLNLGNLDKNQHTLDLTAYGNRINTFGTIHNCNTSTTWFGPNGWRTTGNNWSYEYQLKPMGVLISPTLTSFKK